MFGAAQEYIYLALWLGLAIVKVFAAIDCLRRPADAFPAIGRRSKVLWVILTVVAALTGLLPSLTLNIVGIAAIVIALVYLFDVRPKIIEITTRKPW